MPWWRDQHHWNPTTLKKKNLSQLLALRTKMLDEERNIKQHTQEQISQEPEPINQFVPEQISLF